MSRTTKSNPEYTKLAHKKAILQELVVFLTSNFTAAYGTSPKKIHCEEVFQDENEVPEQFISEFIADQNKIIHRIEDELGQYALEKRHDKEQQQEGGQESTQRKADVGKPGYHRQGAARKRAAAAQ